MKKKNQIHFIVLPEEDAFLSPEQASLLMGGDICRQFTICESFHGSFCWNHTTDECEQGGGCGEITFCTSRGSIPHCERLAYGEKP